MSRHPASFLDRDGVINVDHDYVHKTENFEFVDGVFDLCRAAKRLGYLIVVITNQAGIGRGFYSEQEFLKLSDWMCEIFKSQGIVIDKVYFCPFHREHGVGNYKTDSPCRKPAPRMIHLAEQELDIDLAKSVLVGDKETDIQAGITAGVGRTLLYYPSEFEKPLETKATSVVKRLSDGCDVLLRRG
jgi:D-glycero-D-manno-heptose 1,7-bisphosphate phosphatase